MAEMKMNKKTEEIKTIKGKSLVGARYKPIFPYFSDNKNSFVILHGDFVTVQDGTGIVHCAPGFGEDDFELCRTHNIKVVCPVDEAGCFTDEMVDLEFCLGNKREVLSIAKKQVFETNDDIIKFVKSRSLLVKTKMYSHSYPHCWRTDTPLIYKALSSWYIKVSAVKDKMIKVNQDINWIPSHIKNGIFGKWLENTRDWSISRNRFWGCPIPIWRSTDPRYPRIDVYGSIEEMETDFQDYYEMQHGTKLKITNLHRPFVDSLMRPNPDDPTGKSFMKRVEDVLDCWFESGAMPFASIHYPFDYRIKDRVVRTREENIEWFNQNFPADFVVEYIAQTRGWFYTMVVLAAALFEKAPFLNCICHGVVLDKNGEKLSKRLRNYPDPIEMFDLYGSDAMRFAMVSSNVMKGREISIDVNGDFIKEMLKRVVVPFYNSFSFLRLYMQADGLDSVPDKINSFLKTDSPFLMDRYILCELNDFIQKMRSSLDAYDTVLACELVEGFLESLNNWYIRRTRKRFWSSIKFKGAYHDEALQLLEKVKKSSLETQKNLANKTFSISQEESGLDYWEYIESVMADAILNQGQQPWRMKVDMDNKDMVLIDNDKQCAYQTLYFTILTLCKTVAPLLPHTAEKIYLELIK